MTRLHDCLLLLSVAAAISACGSDTTGPGGTATTNNYFGTIASPVATGSFTAVVVTTATSAALAEPPKPAAVSPASYALRSLTGGGAAATITITLLNGTTLTLTGSVSGTSFTVGDSNGDSCTGTAANALNATCSLFGQPTNLLGVLKTTQALGLLTTYCGLETLPSPSTTVQATILLGVTGTSSPTDASKDVSFIARVATSDNSLSFYLDQAATYRSLTAAPQTPGNTNSFIGASTSGSVTWAGTDVNSLGAVIGAWTAANPCQLYVASLGGNSTLTFTAPVNTAPATQSVTVLPTTVGPLTAVVPASAAAWLHATTSGNTVVLAALAQATAGPLTATVNVWPQFASNAPLPITVIYNVTSASQPLEIPSTALLTAVDLSAYSDQLVATGGTGHYTWSIPAGSPIPGWLSLNPATGVLSGTPPVGAPSPVTFSVMVSDGTSSFVQSVTLTIYPNVTITTASPLPAATVGSSYSQQLVATGGPPGGYTWSLTPGSNALPSGLALSPSGLISGSPTTATTTPASFSVTASDGVYAGQQTFMLAVGASVVGSCVITPTSIDPLNVGTFANIPLIFTAGCGTNFNIQWQVPTGSLPAGLTILPDINALSGTPTASGPYSFSLCIQGTTSVGQACLPQPNPSYSGVVGPVLPCMIGPVALPQGKVGTSYSVELESSIACTNLATDNVSKWNWSIGGNVPPNLVLGTSSQGTTSETVFGTPTTANTYTFTITFTNTNPTPSISVTQSFTVTIVP
jgi:hypothetical protein